MSQYLGDISAYALAVSQGYTGTEEEYAELMASYATVGQTAVTAAQTATTKASEAATSATTATNKASEAATSATTATTAAEAAQADADAVALDASQALSAASTATSKASEATTAAATATSAATTATTAKDDAVSAKTAAQTAQTGAETAAASVQSSAAQIQTNADDISELKEDFDNAIYQGSAISTNNFVGGYAATTLSNTYKYVIGIISAGSKVTELKQLVSANSTAIVKLEKWEYNDSTEKFEYTETVTATSCDADPDSNYYILTFAPFIVPKRTLLTYSDTSSSGWLRYISGTPSVKEFSASLTSVSESDFQTVNNILAVKWTYLPSIVTVDSERINTLENEFNVLDVEVNRLNTSVIESVNLTSASTGTVYLPYIIKNGDKYIIKNNSAAGITCGTSQKSGGADTQTIGSVFAGSSVEFTASSYANYIRVWASSAIDITVTHSDSLEAVSQKTILNLNTLRSNKLGYGSFDAPCIRGYYSNGSYVSSAYRVCTSNMVTYSEDVSLKIKNGYRFGIQTLDDDNNVVDSGWITTAKIPKNTPFHCVIAKDPDASVPVDIEEYKKLLSVRIVPYENEPLNKPFFATNQLKVAMHRGYCNGDPENSIASFTNAGVAGAWGIETDIRETSDGYFICMHDTTVDRTTSGTGTVSEMTLAEIEALTLSDGSAVPTFEDFLGICKTYSCIPIIEIKGINNAQTSINNILETVEKYGLTGRCMITCSTFVTAMIRNTNTSIPCIVNVDTTNTSMYAQIVDVVKMYENMFIAFEHSDTYLTDEIIQDAHSNQIGVNVWVLNTVDDIKAHFNRSVDMVTSDSIYKY